MNGGPAFRITPNTCASSNRAERALRRLCWMLGCWLLLSLGAWACASVAPRVPRPSRPLDETRAVQVIANAFSAEGEPPAPGHEIQLEDSKLLKVDVQARDHQFGVAYLSQSELRALGAALPPRDPAMGDALQLMSGMGEHANIRILVLHDSDYMYDDHQGDSYRASTITAERKLERDVRDFLTRAHAEIWP